MSIIFFNQSSNHPLIFKVEIKFENSSKTDQTMKSSSLNRRTCRNCEICATKIEDRIRSDRSIRVEMRLIEILKKTNSRVPGSNTASQKLYLSSEGF